jgi:hypothetical protein
MERIADSLCTVGLVILVIGLIIIIVRRIARRRNHPAGTNDSPEIGRQPASRAYDDPEIESGASIGGGPRVQEKPVTRKPSGLVSRASSEWSATEVSFEDESDEEPVADKQSKPYRVEKSGGRVDSPDIKSGGSFGG